MLRKLKGRPLTWRFEDYDNEYGHIDQSWELEGELISFEVHKFQGLGEDVENERVWPEFELDLVYDCGILRRAVTRRAFKLECFHPLRYGMTDRLYHRKFEIDVEWNYPQEYADRRFERFKG